MFAKLLRALAATKIVRPGTFRTRDEGYALRCSYKADDGYIYPLERAFFCFFKPPTVIQYDDIRALEFGRQSGALSSKTFDVTVRTSTDTFQFRGIVKEEWQNLLNFLQAKRIPIENLADAQAGPRGAAAALNMDDVDHMAAMMESSGEDSDFELKVGTGMARGH